MKELIEVCNEKYIDQEAAIKRGIVSKRTLRGRDRPIPIRINRRLLLPVKALSTTIQNRIKAENFDTTPKGEGHDFTKEVNEIGFILSFIDERPEDHKIYSHHYKKFQLGEQEKLEYIRTHALVVKLIGFKCEGYFVKSLFAAYQKLHAQRPFTNFTCNSYDYFTSKLSAAEFEGVENVIVNAKRGETRKGKKFTKIHEKYALSFYKDPLRFRYKQILVKVNNAVMKHGLLPVKIGVLKKFLNDPLIRNKYNPIRFGLAWAKENLYPHLTRRKPMLTNNRWETDSSELPYYIWIDENATNHTDHQLCIVVDVKARKVLSYHVRETEDEELVEITLFKAVAANNVVPRELVHDNALAYIRSQRVLEVEERMQEQGCKITVCTPGEPQEKGTVELVHKLLNLEYLRFTEGWMPSPDLKSDEYQVSDLVRREYSTGKKKVFLRDVLKNVEKAVTLFNNGEVWI